MKKPTLSILGTRGIPACHGGFETFAQELALYLVERGWRITVYCQAEKGKGPDQSEWNGIRLIHIPVGSSGSLGSIIFDWKAVCHSLSEPGLILTLGYNTAIFTGLYNLFRRVNIINMDGIEWRRDKWGCLAKIWLYANERLACFLGSHLVADNPEIKAHLASRCDERKISMIPYGARRVVLADESLLKKYNLVAGEYSLIVARPEPENSIIEVVSAFSKCERAHKLVVLGKYDSQNNSYHKLVTDVASSEVLFLGAIYQKEDIDALRYFAKLYIHGHRVGGTNPSLVEALGSGSAVLAHDNPFNRWVAGSDAEYFTTEDDCERLLKGLLQDADKLEIMKKSSLARFEEKFTWPNVLEQYENMLLRYT